MYSNCDADAFAAAADARCGKALISDNCLALVICHFSKYCKCKSKESAPFPFYAVCGPGYYVNDSDCIMCTGNAIKTTKNNATKCEAACDGQTIVPNENHTHCGKYYMKTHFLCVIKYNVNYHVTGYTDVSSPFSLQ